MTQIDVAQVINTILVLAGILGGTGSALWVKGKKDLHALRDIFDKIDDAATNNNVTEDQFQSVIADARTIIHGDTLPPNPTSTAKSISVSDTTKVADK